MFWRLPEITLAPDVIAQPFGFPITNTLFCTWISIVVLVAIFFFATRRRELIPRGIQNFTEWVVELLRGLAESVAGSKEMGKKFFPLAATFFIFILVCNLLDVFPGVDTVGSINTRAVALRPGGYQIGPFLFGSISNAIIPWIRPATTDINLNLAMALIAVITAQAFGFYTLGPKEHMLKYINLRGLFKFSFEGFILFFVGLLEIISELARIISLSFRLFGNIFAGSVVLAVFAFLLPVFADILFIPFELFVAVVQALVFSLLTLVYLQSAVTSHDAHDSEAEHEERVEHGGEARQTVTSR